MSATLGKVQLGARQYRYELSDADALISAALNCIRESCHREPYKMVNPGMTGRFFQLKLAEKKQEVFATAFLDNRHRLIEYRELFFGTIDGASVHAREVVRVALELNAGAVIIAHNHPSGDPSPSMADERITRRLADALELVDVRVLDHIVVGAEGFVSLAERGML